MSKNVFEITGELSKIQGLTDYREKQINALVEFCVDPDRLRSLSTNPGEKTKLIAVYDFLHLLSGIRKGLNLDARKALSTLKGLPLQKIPKTCQREAPDWGTDQFHSWVQSYHQLILELKQVESPKTDSEEPSIQHKMDTLIQLSTDMKRTSQYIIKRRDELKLNPDWDTGKWDYVMPYLVCAQLSVLQNNLKNYRTALLGMAMILEKKHSEMTVALSRFPLLGTQDFESLLNVVYKEVMQEEALRNQSLIKDEVTQTTATEVIASVASPPPVEGSESSQPLSAESGSSDLILSDNDPSQVTQTLADNNLLLLQSFIPSNQSHPQTITSDAQILYLQEFCSNLTRLDSIMKGSITPEDVKDLILIYTFFGNLSHTKNNQANIKLAKRGLAFLLNTRERFIIPSNKLYDLDSEPFKIHLNNVYWKAKQQEEDSLICERIYLYELWKANPDNASKTSDYLDAIKNNQQFLLKTYPNDLGKCDQLLICQQVQFIIDVLNCSNIHRLNKRNAQLLQEVTLTSAIIGVTYALTTKDETSLIKEVLTTLCLACKNLENLSYPDHKQWMRLLQTFFMVPSDAADEEIKRSNCLVLARKMAPHTEQWEEEEKQAFSALFHQLDPSPPITAPPRTKSMSQEERTQKANLALSRFQTELQRLRLEHFQETITKSQLTSKLKEPLSPEETVRCQSEIESVQAKLSELDNLLLQAMSRYEKKSQKLSLADSPQSIFYHKEERPGELALSPPTKSN